MSQGSLYFNGTGAYIQFASSSQLVIPTNTTPFTIECWLYPLAGDSTFFSEAFTGSGDTIAVTMGFCDGTNPDSAGRYIVLAAYNGSSWVTGAISTTQVSLNTWTHVAGVFTGSTTKIYINGVDVTKTSNPTPATTWAVVNDNGDGWYLGRRWDTSARTYYSGHISNFRMVIGTAVYTGNFSVPTSKLDAITNTQLLLAVDPLYIKDQSLNNFTLTSYGGAYTSQRNPFRTNWLGEGVISQEDFNSDKNSINSKLTWSNTNIGIIYR